LAQATIVLQPENKETGAKTSSDLWSCPPKDVHAEKVKASFKNDALEVRLPKTEEAKAKEIQSEGWLNKSTRA
jgi:hypothetical protein